MTENTKDIIKEHIHLIKARKFYTLLGKIPQNELWSVIKMFHDLGVNPFLNWIKTAKDLHSELWWLTEGINFTTTNTVEQHLSSGGWGDIVGDYLYRVYHNPLGHSIKNIKEVLGMWDDLDSYNELSDYWINQINEVFYEDDNWSIELDRASNGSVVLRIMKGSTVRTVNNGNDEPCVMYIAGMRIGDNTNGLSKINIQFKDIDV